MKKYNFELFYYKSSNSSSVSFDKWLISLTKQSKQSSSWEYLEFIGILNIKKFAQTPFFREVPLLLKQWIGIDHLTFLFLVLVKINMVHSGF